MNDLAMKELVAGRIRQARQALSMTQKELAAAAGMPLPSLSDYELGKTMPGSGQLALLMKAGISANWLLTGEGPMLLTQLDEPGELAGKLELACAQRDELAESLRKALERRHSGYAPPPGHEADADAAGDRMYVPIPRYVVTGDKGEEREVPSEIASVALRRDWLESQGLNPFDLVFFRMQDDSMSPTIRPGALLVVDSSTNHLRGDGIYGLMLNGQLTAKRLQLDFGGGGLWVRSDNQAYRDQQVPIETIDGRTALLGRVIWCAGPVQE